MKNTFWRQQQTLFKSLADALRLSVSGVGSAGVLVICAPLPPAEGIGHGTNNSDKGQNNQIERNGNRASDN